MRIIVSAAFASFLCLWSLPASAAPLNLYVSTIGNDTWSGSLPAPSRHGTDGPLASLTAAVSRIRELSQSGKLPKDGALVQIRGGVYYQAEPLVITAVDTSGLPVAIKAYRNEPVAITGGKRVTSWSAVTDPQVLARIDPAARTHIVCAELRPVGISDYGQMSARGFGRPIDPAGLELFFNGEPMTLARWPEPGDWSTITQVPKPDRFGYASDRPEHWSDPSDIWVHGYWTWDWADSYEHVASIDTQNREIVTSPPFGAFGYKAGQRWYALNILEELNQPGEWYLDRVQGKLYFWPPSSAKTGNAVVSMADKLVVINHVPNVTLHGLTLEDCRGSAVTISSGENDAVSGCKIHDIGNVGVEIWDSSNTGVAGCDISSCGDGGVILSGGDRKKLTAGNCYVVDCNIHDYSRWDRTYRPGVDIGGVGNRIEHCLIWNAPHEAIALSGNDHLIDYNIIHDVCYETGDCGAIYMGRDWTMRGNIVRYNSFSNIRGPKGLSGYHDASAIYLDDTFCGALVYGNLISNADRGILVGGGRDNTVENNVIVNCGTGVSLDARGLGWAAKYILPGGGWEIQEKLAAVPYASPPYSTKYPHLAGILSDNPSAPKYDIIARNIVAQTGEPLAIDSGAGPGATVIDNSVSKTLSLAQLPKPRGFQAVPQKMIGPIRP